MSMLGKPLTSVCDIPRHNPQILQMLDSCYVDASSPQQWNGALRFSSQQNMEALLFVFNQIGGESTVKVEPSETLVTDKSSKEDTHRSLSLADPEIKFAVRFASSHKYEGIALTLSLFPVHQAILPASRSPHLRQGYHHILDRW